MSRTEHIQSRHQNKQYVEITNSKRAADIAFIIAFVWVLAGCSAIGPATVDRDRFDYVNAISDSWKRQMLLNLAKARYMDSLVFLEVSAIINQYEMESEISLGASWNNPPFSSSQSIGGAGRYTDRPTITYSPLMGEKFARSLMTPLPVSAVLFMIQSGYPVDFVLRTCVQSINGIENRFGGHLMERPADQKFYQMLRALKQVQNSNNLGMKIKPVNKDKEAIVMFFRIPTNKDDTSKILASRQILGLDPNASEFLVFYGSHAANDKEIAIMTRSMLQIIVELASYIDVPSEDIRYLKNRFLFFKELI